MTSKYLGNAIEVLSDVECAEIKGIPETLVALCRLNDSCSDQDLEQLRKKFLSILNNPIYQANTRLIAGVYEALLALAELKPLNLEDPISCEAILEKNKVFISSGHQLDIHTLYEFHKTRPFREEEKTKKLLVNPLTNIPFSSKDSEHIQAEARAKKIKLSTDASRLFSAHVFFRELLAVDEPNNPSSNTTLFNDIILMNMH